jgi:hypothetical protein
MHGPRIVSDEKRGTAASEDRAAESLNIFKWQPPHPTEVRRSRGKGKRADVAPHTAIRAHLAFIAFMAFIAFLAFIAGAAAAGAAAFFIAFIALMAFIAAAMAET